LKTLEHILPVIDLAEMYLALIGGTILDDQWIEDTGGAWRSTVVRRGQLQEVHHFRGPHLRTLDVQQRQELQHALQLATGVCAGTLEQLGDTFHDPELPDPDAG